MYFSLLIYPNLLKTPVRGLCSWLQDPLLRKSTPSLLTTCCPQNFLATHTVHEPRPGPPCPIACLQAQPVSCVIINPLSPEDTETERSRCFSAQGLCWNPQRTLTFIFNAKSTPPYPPIFLISSFLLICNSEDRKKPKC